MSRLSRVALWLVGGTVAAAAMLVVLAAIWTPGESWARAFESTPGELIRYAQRRLQGHDRLEAVAQPALAFVQRQVERPVPPGPLPDLGKGQRALGLSAAAYSSAGVPLPARAAVSVLPAQPADMRVGSIAELARAMAAASAGQVIEIDAGDYLIDRRLVTGGAGTPRHPIVLRAARPGTVALRVQTVEAIVVTQPYWLVENLTLRGVCARHGDCEHAFHVVGKAHGTVLRNNRAEDFNAHVKVNGHDGHFPDDGLLQFNTLVNTAARRTDKPVTPVDIVAASGWRVADNLIGGFVKVGGNGVSYGLFMKGAGSGGRIDRNLVLCSPSHVSQPGARVGISLGNGGTGAAFCRDGQCAYEHAGGRIVNNVVAHCNDFGIDVFRAVDTLVAHNTLINTAGIDLRREPARAEVLANVLDGRIRARDGAVAVAAANVVAELAGKLEDPDRLGLRWLSVQYPDAPPADAQDDFCGDLVGVARLPGAIGRRQSCALQPK